MYCDVDGTFPNHHPDPSKPENLSDLIARVKADRLELGFAFDGDGDRLGVVTKDGHIIYPDRQLMLFAADVLAREPGATVIYDVKSTRNLKPWIARHGGKPLLWKTGHSLIKGKMKEVGAALAGEMSGHTFFRERWYGFDDGLYAGARLLEILSRHDDPSTVLDALPDAVSTPELTVGLRRGRASRARREARGRGEVPRARPTSCGSTACGSSIRTASASRAARTRRRRSCCASRPTTPQRSSGSRANSDAC